MLMCVCVSLILKIIRVAGVFQSVQHKYALNFSPLFVEKAFFDRQITTGKGK